MLDMHGLFYEVLWGTSHRSRHTHTPHTHTRTHTHTQVPAFTWGGATWGIKPVSQHLRMVPDFASFRGFLVLGGNQVSSIFDANWVTGQVSFFFSAEHFEGGRGGALGMGRPWTPL